MPLFNRAILCTSLSVDSWPCTPTGIYNMHPPGPLALTRHGETQWQGLQARRTTLAGRCLGWNTRTSVARAGKFLYYELTA